MECNALTLQELDTLYYRVVQSNYQSSQNNKKPTGDQPETTSVKPARETLDLLSKEQSNYYSILIALLILVKLLK